MSFSRGIVDALQTQEKRNRLKDISANIPEKININDENAIKQAIHALEELQKFNKKNVSNTKSTNVIKKVLEYRDELKDTIDTIDDIKSTSKVHKFNELPKIDGGAREDTGVDNEQDLDIVTKFIADINNITQSSKDVMNSFNNLMNTYNSIINNTNTETVNTTRKYFNIPVSIINTSTLSKEKIAENAGPIDELNKNAKELSTTIKEFVEGNKKQMEKLEKVFKNDVKPLIGRYYKGASVLSENKKIKRVFEESKKKYAEDLSNLKRDFDVVLKKISGYANQVSLDARKDTNERELSVLREMRGRGIGRTGGDNADDRDHLEKLKESMERLKQSIERQMEIKQLGQDFGDTSNIPDIYTDIYEKYMKKRQDAEAEVVDEQKRREGLERADEEFLNDIERHKLIPKYAYKITITDRLLFIILMLIVKTLVMSTVEYLIDNEWLQGVMGALVVFCIIYLSLMTAFIYAINNGGIYLRSLMAYANLEVNRGGILLHYILVVMFLLAVFIIYLNIDLKDVKGTVQTVEDRIELASKVDMISNVIVVFCAVFILVI